MGSAPSSNVQPIQLDQENDYNSGDRPSSTKSNKSGREKLKISSGRRRATDIQLEEYRKQLEACRAQLVLAESKATETKERADQTERQMAEVEGQNLDLQDQIQTLQEQLQLVLEAHAKDAAKQADTGFSETLQLKEQHIHRLEQQGQQQQQEFQKLKLKYKKRIKLLNAKLSEAMHESSLEMHETKCEIKKLKEENAELFEKLQRKEGSDASEDTSQLKSSMNQDRMRIILDLSNKVSEQDQIIQGLRAQIETAKNTKQQIKSQRLATKDDRKVSSSKGSERPRYNPSPRSGSETNLQSTNFADTHGSDTSRTGDSHLTDNLHFNEETHWCAKVEDTPREKEFGVTATKRYSTWEGVADPTEPSEIQQIAREMKKIQHQAKRKKKKAVVQEETQRQPSGVSRDSGVSIEPDISNTAELVTSKTSKGNIVQGSETSPQTFSRLSSYGSLTSLNNLLSLDDSDPDEIEPFAKNNESQDKDAIHHIHGTRCIDDTLSKTKRNKRKVSYGTELYLESVNRESLQTNSPCNSTC